jgi:hypothetical protein
MHIKTGSDSRRRIGERHMEIKVEDASLDPRSTFEVLAPKRGGFQRVLHIVAGQDDNTGSDTLMFVGHHYADQMDSVAHD